MAEKVATGHGATGNVEEHDGRFGERFDDELEARGVFYVAVGIAAFCLVGIVITYFVVRGYESQAAANAPAPSPLAEVGERRLPEGPLLQAHPEAEYRELVREMDEKLNGYAWVDESQGIARIPIDKAIEVLLERGLDSATQTASAMAADGSEEAASE